MLCSQANGFQGKDGIAVYSYVLGIQMHFRYLELSRTQEFLTLEAV